MKKILVSSVIAAATIFASVSARAQFKNGKDMIGPQIGLSQYGGTITLGGMFEAPITHPNDVGPGIIGISGELNYYHYSWYADFGVTWIVISVYGNYHFLLDNRSLDPFAGIGLDYESVSATGVGYAYGNSIGIGFHGGLRYFFSPNLAGRVMLSTKTAFLTLGLDFGF